MTNKELINELAKRLSWTQGKTSDVLDATVSIINQNLANSNSINVQGFGAFDVKKMQERVTVHPVSKQRFLVPPKIVPAFRPSQAVKDKLKNMSGDE
ncbi:HU family DNA-binding protein [Dysgonomonas sp. 520]|uniref:HU family DNA-binding protein n=1 Tax=Dysgonomonas sp. 520 TaxID=2302931 RepID=UPI0013D4A144|nr:HU family DNA-binding protein [Dysgonomonas sp. 520]NDW09594.1 HU family DNA-binding protein [Dysgonomonas sp. 520]